MDEKYRVKYLIVGAGLAGLSSAYFLKNEYLIAEASDSLGGTAGTINYKGFKLDNAVHVFYCRKNKILDWIINTLSVEMSEEKRDSAVYINGRFVKFPIQYNLSDLSLYSRYRSISSIGRTMFVYKGDKKYSDFEEYSLKNFGNYITDIFIRPYNQKLFGTELNKLNIEWMGDYVPKYSKSKIILSALSSSHNKYGRNSIFHYPVTGGISKIAEGISAELNKPPLFNMALIKIFPDKKIALFSNGAKIIFDYLINTMPLNLFINKLGNPAVKEEFHTGLLRKNSTTILHLLFKGNINHHNYHWMYFPDPDIPFYRITIPGNICSANCPSGYSAITLEYGGNVYKYEDLAQSSISALKRLDVVNQNVSDIEFFWKILHCGYIIYDKNRRQVLNNILPYLAKNQIWSIGRYGKWEYSNMEDAMIQGKNIAEQLKNQI